MHHIHHRKIWIKTRDALIIVSLMVLATAALHIFNRGCHMVSKRYSDLEGMIRHYIDEHALAHKKALGK